MLITTDAQKKEIAADKSRLYGYKMEEYKGIDNVLSDISLSRSNLKTRVQTNWIYPCIRERFDLLHLNWICYEDIIEREFVIGKIDLTESNWEKNSDILFVINEIKKLGNGV